MSTVNYIQVIARQLITSSQLHMPYPPFSDGVGRTGTFICLHSQLERLKTEGVVDFFQAVKSARIQRAGLVPDAVCLYLLCMFVLFYNILSQAHYAFCHDVVASYVDSFETYANFKEVV